uniref:Major capsid protein n=1 Tax=Macrostomum lignano TaxID=282301 RepID=A0A1I8I525_9PLAT
MVQHGKQALPRNIVLGRGACTVGNLVWQFTQHTARKVVTNLATNYLHGLTDQLVVGVSSQRGPYLGDVAVTENGLAQLREGALQVTENVKRVCRGQTAHPCHDLLVPLIHINDRDRSDQQDVDQAEGTAAADQQRRSQIGMHGEYESIAAWILGEKVE